MPTFAPQTRKLWLIQRTTLFYGVMVAQQILVLFVQVRILVEQLFSDACFRITLFYGVMVAQQILVLFVQVRILVEQRKASLKKEAFFMFAGIHNLLTFVK